MKNKIDRISAIRDIVQNQTIGSQEELLSQLQNKGYAVTQATLSRDLKQMQVAKIATRDGGYVYVMPDVAATIKGGLSSRFIPPHSMQGIVSIECSSVLIVIKTKPGYASSIAYDVDVAELKEVMGTIAGDDTILVIPRAGFTTTQVAESLCAVLPKQK